MPSVFPGGLFLVLRGVSPSVCVFVIHSLLGRNVFTICLPLNCNSSSLCSVVVCIPLSTRGSDYRRGCLLMFWVFSSTMTLTSITLSCHFPPSCEDYIFSFASSATKKISDSMVETAHTIKKSVEEGKIDGIIDKAWFLFWLISLGSLG